jgi:hypothetical protein
LGVVVVVGVGVAEGKRKKERKRVQTRNRMTYSKFEFKGISIWTGILDTEQEESKRVDLYLCVVSL